MYMLCLAHHKYVLYNYIYAYFNSLFMSICIVITKKLSLVPVMGYWVMMGTTTIFLNKQLYFLYMFCYSKTYIIFKSKQL